MKILVAGGGIGGLTAALALARRGHAVTVVERAPAFSAVGAGIILAPNAVRLLERVQVRLDDIGHPLRALAITRADGRTLQHIDLVPIRAQHGPAYALIRADLHQALGRAIERAGVTVRFGDHVARLDETPTHVTAHLGDGDALAVDHVIGADGIHSATRAMIGLDRPLRYSGVTCWRTIVPGLALDGAIEAWHGRARIGAVPLRDGRTYVFLVLTAPPRAPTLTPDELRVAFAGFGGPLVGVVDAVADASRLHHDLDEVDTPVWGRGRVALLGDAAHAMTPNQGQGAAMAIEDAHVLAEELDRGGADPIATYARRRHARVRRVQLDSRRLGRVAHWTSGIAIALRNGLLRALPARLGRAQYARVVEPGLRLLDAGA